MAGAKWAAALRHPDPSQRRKAAFTLGNIGPSDPAVLTALTDGLKDADAGVRREAILALVKYGPGATSAIAALSELREHDSNPMIRACAAKAVEKLNQGP
jgi:HEAT repeat protein